MGRPTKRTPALEKKIFDALKMGATRGDAGAVAGISRETFSQWLKEFPDFSDKVEAAEAEPANRAAARILSEVLNPDGDWRAAESYLKRRRKADWGDQVTQEHTGNLTLEVFERTAAQNDAKLDRIVERRAATEAATES